MKASIAADILNVDMHIEVWLLPDEEVEGIGDRHSSVSPNVNMRLEAWLLSSSLTLAYITD